METHERLRSFIADELQAPQDTLADDYPLIANHVIDSLGLLQIVSFLEGEFGIEVLDEELVPDNFETINAMVAMVETKTSAQASR